MRLLPLPDDHGCFDARTTYLRTRLFPFCMDRVSEKQIEGWLGELQSVDGIRLWVHSTGIRYGVFPNWAEHQRIRSLHLRKTPPPPNNIGVDNKGDVNCRQPLTTAALNPNLNPNPDLNLERPIGLVEEAFAKRLADLLFRNNPNRKQPSPAVLRQWAEEAERIFRIDQRNHVDAVEILEWCQQDSFWMGNILSMRKFREQYDQLVLKMEADPGWQKRRR